LLVQWLAPLASEAPELIVAGLFAWRLRGDGALGTLLSAKVNQWTLLVGSLPLAFLAGGGHHGLSLDLRQTEEFLLTGTQALLALAVVLDLRFRRREAVTLLLFLAQLPFPSPSVRLGFSAAYTVAAVWLLVGHRRYIAPVVRTAIRTADPLPRSWPRNQAAGPSAAPDRGSKARLSG
jgi:cation:H+ antiporter